MFILVYIVVLSIVFLILLLPAIDQVRHTSKTITFFHNRQYLINIIFCYIDVSATSCFQNSVVLDDRFHHFITTNVSNKMTIWLWMTVMNITQLFSKVFSMIKKTSKLRVGVVLTAISTSTMLNNLMEAVDPFTF